MALWDEQWSWTPEGSQLHDKVKEALKPVFRWCVSNSIPFEDFICVVQDESQNLLLLGLMEKQDEVFREKNKAYLKKLQVREKENKE